MGYLCGVAVGPSRRASCGRRHRRSLAEIGVILLMFASACTSDARPLDGAQIAARRARQIAWRRRSARGTGLAVGLSIGAAWCWGSRCRSRARSSCSAALEDQGPSTRRTAGRRGWLLVEDLVTVLVLVLLPLCGSARRCRGRVRSRPDPALTLALEMAAFAAVSCCSGPRVSVLLNQVSKNKSRELFTLAAAAIALALPSLFRALRRPFALERSSPACRQPFRPSHRARRTCSPSRTPRRALLRAVGMLFDLRSSSASRAVLAVVAVVLVGSLPPRFHRASFGRSRETALSVSAALAQIGEFSSSSRAWA